MRYVTLRRVVGLALVVTIAAAACGDDAGESSDSEAGAPSTTEDPNPPVTDESGYPVVRTDGVSGPDIDNITVWAPEADGDWPVVLLLAGWTGIADHYTATAEALAAEGVVVFAPDYRTQAIDGPNWQDTYRDAECAYRHMRSAASSFGGDISQPVTAVGHSIGAVVAMALTLDMTSFGPDGPFDACPDADVPRPDRVVGLGGCYLESGIDGTSFPWDPSTFGWTHYDADIHLVVGADDAVCEAWQSEQAVDLLREDGFENVRLTTLDDADHFDVIFTRWEGDGDWFDPTTEWFEVPEATAGVAAVGAMLETVHDESGQSTDSAAAPTVEVTEVEAANERVKDVTVYTPVEDGAWPAVVLYPGYDQPRSTLDPFARQLAAAGFAVATTDYDAARMVSGDYECAQQFATLAAWDNGGDPAGVTVTGGHFFGASVATMASLFEPFIPLGATDPIDCGLEGQDDIRPTDLVVGLSGSWYQDECDLRPETGPLSGSLPAYVLPYDGNPGVPFVIAHGADNPYCPTEQAAVAATDFEEGGQPPQYLELDGAGFAEGIIFVESDDAWPQVAADPDSDTSKAIVDAIVAAVDALSG